MNVEILFFVNRHDRMEIYNSADVLQINHQLSIFQLRISP